MAKIENPKQVVTFRIQGLSCANCAAQFERNVQELPGVKDARVNFGSSTITITGTVDRQAIEQAGAFDHLIIYADDEEPLPSPPFWKNKKLIRTLISGLLILTGWLVPLFSEEASLPIAFYLLAMGIGGYTLFIQGLKNLINLRFDMKTLMTIAVLGAAAIGEWGEAATVVFLFAISEALETYSMEKARHSIHSLMELAPKQATIRRNGEELLIPVSEIQIGDRMLVRPGQKLAMDGIIRKGSSSINQAAITGESLPIEKKVGDEVYAGTLNEEGLLEVEVTKRVEDTAIAKIIHLVEEAQAERAPAQAFVDRFAQYYTPAIMLISLGIIIIPPLFQGGLWQEWIYRGLAVLVVGCPCALIISTPVAIVTAIGHAARHGVLIKGGVYLEKIGSLSAIAFDKTGTLTKGQPIVTDFVVMNQEESAAELLGIAAAMEQHSTHPLATAIVRQAEKEQLNLNHYHVQQFISITGKGVKAKVNGQIYYIGKPTFIQEVLPFSMMQEADFNKDETEFLNKINDLQSEGKTVMLLATEEKVLAIIAAGDQPRPEGKQVIHELSKLGLTKSIMLTGDNKQSAETIGRQLGLSSVEATLLPEDKLEIIKQLQERYGQVAMVGDGVNDAPALAAASVGIAMGSVGTDTALETADIALMADDLRKLPFTIKLSRQTLAIIKQNISFSIGIKLLALLLIIPGWLTLWLAIFADLGATLIVTLNALRLMRVKE